MNAKENEPAPDERSPVATPEGATGEAPASDVAGAPSAAPPSRARSSRPPFARTFPPHPALDALVVAFAAGDYRTVREEGKRLAAATKEDAAVRSAAQELVDRTEADPLAKALLAITGLLLLFLSVWWVLHSHPSP